MKQIPLFKSHYSLGKSILTLDKPEDSDPSGPDSIISICKENKIKNLYLVDDSMSGFLQGYLNSKDEKINFNFGLRMTFCADIEIKDEDSRKTNCKFIIFAKNKQGYKRLIKISTDAACKGFYYLPRMDFKTLNQYWSDEDLQLAVPFYDSFLHLNTLHHHRCITDFSFSTPIFFTEDNDLPFDDLLVNRVEEYCEKEYEIYATKSIFYKKREDFKSYLTFKCIGKRTSLNKPNFDHMCSEEFCVESWSENGK